MSRMLPALIALLLPIGIAWLGLTNALGAHIWWDVKTIAIGAPIGVGLAYLLTENWRTWLARVVLWLVLLIAAYTLAKYGQTAFANSYGDDQLAGKFWYFGWIATGAATAGLLYSAIKR